jgi:raw score 5.01
MERLIQWLDDQIMYIKEAIERGSATRHAITFWEYDHKNLLLVKEYITDYEKLTKDYEKLTKDYEKLAKDYRDVTSQNRLLKLEKLELEGRHIYEDMRMKYRANRRKWGAKT